MGKHSIWVYKDKVIINSIPPREGVHTMVSCAPVVTVHRTLPVTRVVQVASLHCQPVSTG